MKKENWKERCLSNYTNGRCGIPPAYEGTGWWKRGYRSPSSRRTSAVDNGQGVRSWRSISLQDGRNRGPISARASLAGSACHRPTSRRCRSRAVRADLYPISIPSPGRPSTGRMVSPLVASCRWRFISPAIPRGDWEYAFRAILEAVGMDPAISAADVVIETSPFQVRKKFFVLLPKNFLARTRGRIFSGAIPASCFFLPRRRDDHADCVPGAPPRIGRNPPSAIDRFCNGCDLFNGLRRQVVWL